MGVGVLRVFTVVVSILGFLALAVGCDDHPPTPVGTQQAPQYSPFVVDVSGGDLVFDQISFKDVGMSVPPEDQTFVYETVAEALSARLTEDASMNLHGRVRYSEDAADPAHHHACAANHVYVDLWHDASIPKWGYSLWSGCGEDDQFAWRELATTGPDPVNTVEPLTRDIVADLAHAVSAGCFTRHC